MIIAILMTTMISTAPPAQLTESDCYQIAGELNYTANGIQIVGVMGAIAGLATVGIGTATVMSVMVIPILPLALPVALLLGSVGVTTAIVAFAFGARWWSLLNYWNYLYTQSMMSGCKISSY